MVKNIVVVELGGLAVESCPKANHLGDLFIHLHLTQKEQSKIRSYNMLGT